MLDQMLFFAHRESLYHSLYTFKLETVKKNLTVNFKFKNLWFDYFPVGNACGTLLFEGQSDHLIPSTSQVLAQNEMFIMAGRMIGHSFLHGGPRLTGLSPAVLHVLLDATPQTATITFEDVADQGDHQTGMFQEVQCNAIHICTPVFFFKCRCESAYCQL